MWSPSKILAAALLLAAGLVPGRADTQVGDKFPPLAANAPAGRITLVDFWASWCAPCRMSFPAYAQLHADYAARGLVIVAVSVDENQQKFEAFVKQQTPPFVTVWDDAHRLVSRVKVAAMPTCYLLDRTGRVRFVHQGFHRADTDRELRREIDALLAEPLPSL